MDDFAWETLAGRLCMGDFGWSTLDAMEKEKETM